MNEKKSTHSSDTVTAAVAAASCSMSSTPSQSASQQTTMKIRSNAIENKSVGSSQLAKNTHTLKALSQKMYEWPYLWAA